MKIIGVMMLVLLFIGSAFAGSIETFDGQTSFAPVELSGTFLFNITVDNSAATTLGNISLLEISTTDGPFAEVSGTAGTSSSVTGYTWTDSTHFSWSGDGLVMNNALESFWVSITVPNNSQVHDFQIIASNATGTHASATISIEVKDLTAPKVTIVSPESKVYTQEHVLLNVTLNEKGECVYSLDEGTINLSLNPDGGVIFSANISFDAGKEKASFYCQDDAGNWNVSEYIEFTVDYEEETSSPSETTSPENLTQTNTSTTESENAPLDDSLPATVTSETTGPQTTQEEPKRSVSFRALVPLLLGILGTILLVIVVIKLVKSS